MLQGNLRSGAPKVGALVAGLILCTSGLATAQQDAAAGRQQPHRGHRRVRAETPGDSCTKAFKGAQEKERAAHLREARDLLLECAKSTCNKLLREQCRVRYTQLEEDIPSVVPLVTDETGAPSVDVQVKVDGKPFSPRIDGSSLPLDPGVHEFSFVKGGEVFATRKVMIVQGQRNRPIAVALRASGRGTGRSAPPASVPKLAAPDEAVVAEAPAATPAPSKAAVDSETDSKKIDADENEGAVPSVRLAPKPHRGVLPYVLAGVGAVGLVGFGLGTYWGRKDNDALGTCTPLCDPAGVDRVHRVYLAADIALGVGVAALGAATILWARSSKATSAEDTATEKSAYRFGLQPTRAGALAAMSGSF